MSHKIIDCRGLACPQPVIAVKRALDSHEKLLLVIVDNLPAKENVAKFAASQGCGVCIEEIESGFNIQINKNMTAEATPKSRESSAASQYILITQDTLGQGNSELGAVLMKGFLVAVLERKPLPKTIMFINSGVKLTISESPVLKSIISLQEQGVDILACGTCLDFYGLKDKLAVGETTNMYTIVDKLLTGQAITL